METPQIALSLDPACLDGLAGPMGDLFPEKAQELDIEVTSPPLHLGQVRLEICNSNT